MSGPPPKHPDERRRRNVPAGGEWQVAPGQSWSGEVPEAPEGLTNESIEAWGIWFGSWMASFWQPEDLPALRRMVKLYDECERLEGAGWLEGVDASAKGRVTRPAIPYGELRQLMDRFGLSPAARQRLRWLPPDGQAEQSGDPDPAATTSRRYGHLQAV